MWIYEKCEGCSGEDCACCEIFIEAQDDDYYEDEDDWRI